MSEKCISSILVTVASSGLQAEIQSDLRQEDPSDDNSIAKLLNEEENKTIRE